MADDGDHEERYGQVLRRLENPFETGAFLRPARPCRDPGCVDRGGGPRHSQRAIRVRQSTRHRCEWIGAAPVWAESGMLREPAVLAHHGRNCTHTRIEIEGLSAAAVPTKMASVAGELVESTYGSREKHVLGHPKKVDFKKQKHNYNKKRWWTSRLQHSTMKIAKMTPHHWPPRLAPEPEPKSEQPLVKRLTMRVAGRLTALISCTTLSW